MRQQLELDAVDKYVKVNVDQFHGIEIEDWPAQIAKTAMWLMDHQMNIAISKEFGNAFVRIPLVKSANIVQGNALQLDWTQIIPPQQCSYILGNPPFVGHQYRNKIQMEDMQAVWGKEGRYRRLDYVSCWYYLATNYMKANPDIRTAFVSTNSICQGEQVGILWAQLIGQGVIIHFAHRTFQWSSDAPGSAAVHCIIVGFGLNQADHYLIFDYENAKGEPHIVNAQKINPYLIDAENIILPSRNRPMQGLSAMLKGSQPTDGGHLILSEDERNQIIEQFPFTEEWIRSYIGGREFINGKLRYCLWLKNVSPAEIRKVKPIMERIESVAKSRLKSPTPSVRQWAENPTLFTQDRQPENSYLAIPEVSSERRKYIPIGFLSEKIVASNKLQIIRDGSLYMFGVLSSVMHNAWMRSVGGRLKSDYSYSPSVYNNFPWPEPTATQRRQIENTAQAILDARANHPEATLADLYDPLTMPQDLRQAHHANDQAVDKAYGKQTFTTEAERVGFLFQRYQMLIE